MIEYKRSSAERLKNLVNFLAGDLHPFTNPAGGKFTPLRSEHLGRSFAARLTRS